MDYITTIWISGLVIFIIIQYHAAKYLQEIPIIMFTIGIISYFVWIEYKKHKSEESNINKQFATLETGSKKGHALGKKLLMQNKDVITALIKLHKYKQLDKHLYQTIVDDMIGFFDLYGQIMIKQLSFDHGYTRLLELDRTILNNLASFHVKDSMIYSDVMFAVIVKTLTKIMRAMITVLKNKFGNIQYEFPLAYNMHHKFDYI